VTAAARRPYGELDRDQVVTALYDLARRVGVAKVTMRELAAELGAAAPSVYYHVPGKQAALDLLAEAVLAAVPEPEPGPWDVSLVTLYQASRKIMLDVPGIANVLQTNGNGQQAQRLDRLSRTLIGQAGLRKAATNAAHAVLYTYLLGSVSLEESRPEPVRGGRTRADAHYTEGLHVIIEGIRAMAAKR
jgi:TetR/AcrR family transcriptional regulator, tetracycline repressor protein